MVESPPGPYDLCIVGGGPAGLACAIASAQRGLRVAVLDAMRPPIDKACGEGLMPDSLAALAQLGIAFEESLEAPNKITSPTPGHPLTGIRFLSADGKLQTQATFPHSSGRGIRRLHLHQLLVDRALTLNVDLHWQTVVQNIKLLEPGAPETGAGNSAPSVLIQTSRGPIAARYLVGADGHASRVRTWAHLDRSAFSNRRLALRQHFTQTPWTHHVEVHWSAHGQAYVTPIAPDQVCVAFVSRDRLATVPAALAHFPALQTRLATATPSGKPRGAVTFSRKLHRVTHGPIALLGDASGSVDAVTGEGLALAFRQSLALAEALSANDLSLYQRAHTRLRRLPHLMASTMLLLDRSPRLCAASLTLLARYPGLFARLLALHLGERFFRWSAQNSAPTNGRTTRRGRHTAKWSPPAHSAFPDN